MCPAPSTDARASGGSRNHSGAVSRCEPCASKGTKCPSSIPEVTLAAEGSPSEGSRTRTSRGAPFPGGSWATEGNSGTSVGAAEVTGGRQTATARTQLVSPGLCTASLWPLRRHYCGHPYGDSGRRRPPDRSSTILMRRPATSQSVCPRQAIPGRLTLPRPVPRIAGLCRAAPRHAGPETATYEYRAAH